MVERSGDWLDQAEGDRARKERFKIRVLRLGMLLSSQSAEEAVKAVFQKLGAETWGHSIFDLLSNLSERTNVSEDLLEYALELDKAYIPTRYPNAHPSSSPRRRYTRREAERLIEYAEKIFKFCENILSKI